MLQLYTRYKIWSASDEGASAVEYGILIALIAIAIVAVVAGLGNSLKNTFNVAANKLR